MIYFLQQVIAGLATGTIYALLALALVMIYQAIGHLNFAQGEMATFSTFVAWQLLGWGAPYWCAFLATVLASFVAGVCLERVAFRPLEKASKLSQVVMFVGLLSVFNSLSGFIWDFNVKSFPSPFGSAPLFGSALISAHQAGMMLVTLLLLGLVFGFFNFTRAGLAMRAAAHNPTSARLVGIRVGRTVALGWGFASAIGAVAGMMVAPIIFLEPNMMLGVLIYGFAGAVLGGLSSYIGPVVGGLLVGVVENIAGTYIPVVGAELKLSVALAIIIAVLIIRPNGLFGFAAVRKV